jgi:predicted nucleotidyltransferase
LVQALKRGLVALSERLPLKRVVLFGSWASGRATAFSDIDLLVIYADPAREDAYREIRCCLDLQGLEPHVYSETEAAQLASTLAKMSAEGIVLLG